MELNGAPSLFPNPFSFSSRSKSGGKECVFPIFVPVGFIFEFGKNLNDKIEE